MLRARRSEFDRFSAVESYFLPSEAFRTALYPQRDLFVNTRVFSRSSRGRRREANHSRLPTVEVNNGWKYISIFPILLHTVEGKNFTFCKLFLFG